MTDSPYLPCREVLDFLYLYLAEELPPEERAEFDRHLGVCPSCVNYVESYRQTIALGRAAFPAALDSAEPVPEELVAAIRSARRQID
jgi:anti-sigma factor RsiW